LGFEFLLLILICGLMDEHVNVGQVPFFWDLELGILLPDAIGSQYQTWRWMSVPGMSHQATWSGHV
jgi:hypothetical protein